MTRRSFYLSNLRRISGCGKNDEDGGGKGENEIAVRERERGKEKREQHRRRRRRRRWRYDSSFSVHCQHSQLAALKASLRGLRFTSPRRRKRERERASFPRTRTVDRMLNYAIRVFCLLARLRVCGILQVEHAD